MPILLPSSLPAWHDRLIPQMTLIPSNLPPTARLFLIGAIASISGLLYGLDTGTIGPITQMPQFQDSVGALSSSLEGFFVASILLSASVSSLASGYIAEKYSRRYAMLIGALVLVCGTIASAASQNLGSLFAARLLTGLGAGQTISIASIYLIEIATRETRGTLACLLQFSITIGIMTGYFMAYGAQKLTSSVAWRLPFIMQAVVASILALMLVLVVPFSPRWLVQQDRELLAFDVLRQLRLPCKSSVGNGSSALDWRYREEQSLLQCESEFNEIKEAVQALRLSANRQATFAELFSKRFRYRTFLGIAIMTFQQLSGIDVILYFAPVVFSSVFRTQDGAFLASGGSGIVLVLATIPAQVWVDRWGRKPPMVLGGAGMAVCFLVIGSLFATSGVQIGDTIFLTDSAAKIGVVVLIYTFIALFSVSWAVVCRIYAVEIMPTRLRSRASAIQQLANWMTNFTVALIAPTFLRASPSGPYFLFAGCLTCSTVGCATFMRETKGKTLEQISNLFDERTS